MEAYIDLSYIFHLLLCISSLKFSKIICNKFLTREKLLLFEISSLVIYLNALLFPNIAIYLNLIYYLLIFYLFNKKEFFSFLLSYIFSYYSQVSIIRIFTNNIYLYKSVVMIYNPTGFFYILMCPLLLLIVNLVTKSIKSLIVLKKYRYNVKVNIENRIYEASAYFDSGNTLKYKDLPVVFLTKELKDNKLKYEKFLVSGIGKESSEYRKGKIIFEDKERDVYFAYVNKKNFNGCKCLLNVYLLG